MLADLRSIGMTGKTAEQRLDAAGITVNKNTIPNDPEKPMVTSGIRLGTAAITSRGMRLAETRQIGKWIERVLLGNGDPEELRQVRAEVAELCCKFPIYPV